MRKHLRVKQKTLKSHIWEVTKNENPWELEYPSEIPATPLPHVGKQEANLTQGKSDYL